MKKRKYFISKLVVLMMLVNQTLPTREAIATVISDNSLEETPQNNNSVEKQSLLEDSPSETSSTESEKVILDEIEKSDNTTATNELPVEPLFHSGNLIQEPNLLDENIKTSRAPFDMIPFIKENYVRWINEDLKEKLEEQAKIKLGLILAIK